MTRVRRFPVQTPLVEEEVVLEGRGLEGGARKLFSPCLDLALPHPSPDPAPNSVFPNGSKFSFPFHLSSVAGLGFASPSAFRLGLAEREEVGRVGAASW